jgi:SSS family solute:Na+ symporter
MNAALVIIFAVILLALLLGLRASRGRDMNLEQWSVGGRGFGTIFVFLLLAGEIYTTFTFLGGSGWAYSKGGPAFYILCYGALAYVMSYWLLPVIWRYGTEHSLVSQSDFFSSKYRSPYLGVLVSLVGVVAMVPYLVLQLTGLGIIVSEASYGSISSTAAILIGTVALTVYVMVSGIHGSAWTAVLKDAMILVVAVFLGIYLPLHYYGGIGEMFSAVQAAKPGFVALPSAGLSPSWFISTVLLTAFGFYMWPQFFGATFSAQNERVFRRNAIVLPLYQLILLFIFFVGFAAILQVPGLKGAGGDLSLLRLVKDAFPTWLVGVVGAAGVLTALVPGSMLLMTSATLLANNVFPVFAPAATERQIGRLARATVPVVAVIALLFTFRGGAAIVSLLLAGYSLVTQLFPALLASLPRRPVVPKEAAATGIIAGVATVAYLTVSKTTVATLLPGLPQWIKDLNVGIVALLVNLAALGVVTFVMRALSGAGAATSPAPVRTPQPAGADDRGRS